MGFKEISKCACCGKDISQGWEKRNRTEIEDGIVCAACALKLPLDVVYDDEVSVEAAKEIIAGNEQRKAEFAPTYEYGKLMVDGKHKTVGISTLIKGSGKKDKAQRNLFALETISGISLYLTDIQVKGKKAVCNVKLAMESARYGLKCDVVIAEKICCVVNGGQKEVTEPAELTMMRNLINQCFDDIYNGAKHDYDQLRAVEERLKSGGEAVREMKARMLFMLDEGEEYTLQELKQKRNALMKAFHPDANGNGDIDYNKCSAAINEAYKVLADKIS